MTAQPSWRLSLIALLLAWALVLGIYWPTALGMVEIWWRSGTFTHAFLVLPISLWLVWRLRQPLAALTPQATPWLALALLGAGGLWLLGELAAVNAATQFALVSMLVLSVPMLLGMPLTRAIAFPLLFLYFCVPFGEFVMPTLMHWTADITVLGVRLSGVPVYQEGLQFVIPSGHWSVIEACSGIRYLIASVCVGMLFAYLNYRSTQRRVLFVIAAAAVPLVANWIRAYGIVMLGHLSGNRIATGVDHLVYGWVFFGIVMTGLFMAGMRWQEPETVPEFHPAPPGRARSLPLTWLLFAIVLLLPRAGLWLVERGNAASAPVLATAALNTVGNWQAEESGFSSWRPAFTPPAADWQRNYRQGERRVGAYVAYYRKQDSQHKLVSSENVLARSEDDFWAVVTRGAKDADGLAVRTATLRGGSVGGVNEQRLLVWQWYWIDGELTASDIKAKLLGLKARLLGRGDDGAIVVVYAPVGESGGSQNADAALADFAPRLRDALAPILTQTREQR